MPKPEDIAVLLGIAKAESLRHCGKEIALAPVRADQAIAANLYNHMRTTKVLARISRYR